MSAITVKLKCVSPADKALVPQEVKSSLDSTVESIKLQITEKNEVPVEEQKLIYKGKVLVNEKTLADYSVKDGDMFVYLRTKKKKKTTETTPASSTTEQSNTDPVQSNPSPVPPAQAQNSSSSQNSFQNNAQQNMFGFGDMPPLNPFGGGFDMSQMQETLQNNPEMMNNLLNSPLMQRMFNNPEVLQNMFRSNPQIQQLAEQNPMLNHILNDPELLRRQMELLQNPQMMQEMRRQQDMAMSHIDNLPGGRDALRRHFNEIQRPMMDALDGRDRERNNNEENTEEEEEQSDQTETNAANPWGNRQQSGNSQQPNLNSLLGGLNLNNPPANSGGSQPNTNNMPNPQQLLHNLALMQQLLPGFGQNQPQGQSNNSQQNSNQPNMANMMQNFQQFNEMMRMSGAPSGTNAPDPNLPPEQRFATQLTQLEQMGFTNRQDNIAALSATNGNVDQAIDRLLGAGF